MTNDLLTRYRITQLKENQATGKRIKLRWNTATEVRRSLARINNMVANGEITAKEANAIFYSANLVLKAIELEQSVKK